MRCFAKVVFPKPEYWVSFKLPCPLVPSCGVSSPVVPGLKALQSRRWREIGETPPARDRRLSLQALPSVYSRRALPYRPLCPRTYSSLSRENLSNKLWPSSSCVAGAAILPYARWFTEICGWGDVWRHVRAWASTWDQTRSKGFYYAGNAARQTSSTEGGTLRADRLMENLLFLHSGGCYWRCVNYRIIKCFKGTKASFWSLPSNSHAACCKHFTLFIVIIMGANFRQYDEKEKIL